MQRTNATERPLRPAPHGDGYPWAREREALDALDRLEMDRSRSALHGLAQEVRLPEGTPVAVAALLLNDLLERVERRLRPTAAVDGSQGQRLSRARRLGNATQLDAVRSAFLTEVDALFAPLASLANQSPAVLRARAFLDRNFTRRITLGQVAEAVHLSPNYLSVLFRRETGLTVTAYLRTRRMRLAEKLLLEGRRTISEVAYEVGYQNYRDFHRNFVRAGGRSPRAFQRLCRSRRHGLGESAPQL